MSVSEKRVPVTASASDGRRELVDRIVGSTTFRKSQRMSNLLSFICDLSLEGRQEQISEQTIGRAVFERSENYDSANDGIVRTQVSRLRSKLDLYFEGEGTAEPLRIIIPRGGYVPFFVPHHDERQSTPIRDVPTTSTPAAEPVPPAKAQTPPMRLIRSATVAWASVAVLLACVVGMLARPSFSLADRYRRHPLWSEIFSPGLSTLLVPADSTMVFWQRVTGQSVGLADYLKGGFREQDFAEPHGQHFGQGRYTSVVDLEVASQLSRIALSGHADMLIRFARDLRPNDLKQGNAVLIGSNETNPWVHLFENDMNFVFSDDSSKELYSVINRKPRGAEPSQWTSSLYNDKEHWVYCVVALRPNLGGNGNVLILEGTSMAGTECAWDFVSDDTQLLPFLRQITLSNGHVPSFELVLGTHNMNGSAVKGTILAWRVNG